MVVVKNAVNHEGRGEGVGGFIFIFAHVVNHRAGKRSQEKRGVDEQRFALLEPPGRRGHCLLSFGGAGAYK